VEALLALIAVLVLASVHAVTPVMDALRGVPRNTWLSTAGGVSVAYVFVLLLPELNDGGEALRELAGPRLAFLDRHAYVLALAGLAAFYALDRFAKRRKGEHREDTGEAKAPPAAFWVHIASFAAYNVLSGSLVVDRAEGSALSLTFFTVALGLHFLVADYGLLEDYPRALYVRYGRWLLCVSLVVGWLLGLSGLLTEGVMALLTAFLAGGIIMNVFKEELPEERQARLGAFLIGLFGYAALLLAI